MNRHWPSERNDFDVEHEIYREEAVPSTRIAPRSSRNRALFLEGGHANVDRAYGVSFMLNVSSEISGVGAGVLIRAIEPTVGVTIMKRNRGAERVRDLARGPGRLCEALGSIAGWTGSTSVRPARCRSDPTVRRRTKSGRANGSALRAQPTVRCGSTFGAMGSSAVRRRSIDERRPVRGSCGG